MFGKKTTQVMCPPHCITSSHFVPSHSVMLNLIAWLRECPPGHSTLKGSFSFYKELVICGVNCDCPVPQKPFSQGLASTNDP